MSDGGLADVLARLGLAWAGPDVIGPSDAVASEPRRVPEGSELDSDEAPSQMDVATSADAFPSLRRAFEDGTALQTVITSSGMPAGRARRLLLKECFGLDVPPRGTLPTRMEAEQLLQIHGPVIARAASEDDVQGHARALGLEEWTLGWLILIHRDRERSTCLAARRNETSRDLDKPPVAEDQQGEADTRSEPPKRRRPWPGRPSTPIERQASAAYIRGAGIIGVAAEVGASTDGALAALVRGLAGVSVSELSMIDHVGRSAEAQREAVTHFEGGASIEVIARALGRSPAEVAWLLLAHPSGRLRALGSAVTPALPPPPLR